MKKLLFLALAVLLLGATFSSCKGKTESQKINDTLAMVMGNYYGTQIKAGLQANPQFAQEIDKDQFVKGALSVMKLDSTKESKSYLYGILFALNAMYGYEINYNNNLTNNIQLLEAQGISIDRHLLIDEFKKAINNKKNLDFNDMSSYNQLMGSKAFQMEYLAGKAIMIKNQEIIDEYIKKNSGYKKTESGIAYKVIKEGTGVNFTDSAIVDIAYVGKHLDGKVFDDSQGEARPFDLRNTVPGFRKAVSLMKPGSKIIAVIPGDQAYGMQGMPPAGIKPNETLVFELTAVGLHKEEQKQEGPKANDQ